MSDPTLDLPGLSTPSAMDPPLVKAARRTLAALVEAGAIDLEGRDALPAELLITLAEAAAAGTRNGRASAAAMSAAQVLACLDRLDARGGGEGGDDEWNALVAEMREAARGAAPVRDEA